MMRCHLDGREPGAEPGLLGDRHPREQTGRLGAILLEDVTVAAEPRRLQLRRRRFEGAPAGVERPLPAHGQLVEVDRRSVISAHAPIVAMEGRRGIGETHMSGAAMSDRVSRYRP